MIASSDVASASTCVRSRKSTSAGTNRIPPPTPSMPATTPAAKPTAMAPAVISGHQERDRDDDDERGEQQRDPARVDTLLQRRTGQDAADRREADEQPVAHVQVAVGALGQHRGGGDDDD